MNPKLNKMRAEREKNERKIAVCRSRNAELDKKITELENLEIVGMVRSKGMSPEELAVLIHVSDESDDGEEGDHE